MGDATPNNLLQLDRDFESAAQQTRQNGLLWQSDGPLWPGMV